MKLYLIRHGQSYANEKKKLISDSTDGLTDYGTTQSQLLKSYLSQKKINPELIYCSTWRRAVETATICYAEVEIKFDERITETNPGIYKDMLEKDFFSKYPDFNKSIYNKYCNGESHKDMADRVKDWINECVIPFQSKEKKVIVFSHGGPISVILETLLGIDSISRYPSFRVPNASITTLEFDLYHERFVLHDIVAPHNLYFQA